MTSLRPTTIEINFIRAKTVNGIDWSYKRSLWQTHILYCQSLHLNGHLVHRWKNMEHGKCISVDWCAPQLPLKQFKCRIKKRHVDSHPHPRLIDNSVSDKTKDDYSATDTDMVLRHLGRIQSGGSLWRVIGKSFAARSNGMGIIMSVRQV
jgi:hypothetical protein